VPYVVTVQITELVAGTFYVAGICVMGSTVALEVPLHWKCRCIGSAVALEVPLHWKYRYIGSAVALEVPLNWKENRHPNFYRKFLLRLCVKIV
jgi:hypothetical protein